MSSERSFNFEDKYLYACLFTITYRVTMEIIGNSEKRVRRLDKVIEVHGLRNPTAR